MWAGDAGHEIVERAERLEALMGMWTGEMITEATWSDAHQIARETARGEVKLMRARAIAEEGAALRRQVDAAEHRLVRERGRHLACQASDDEDLNSVFHRAMQRGGQVAALLERAHGLLGSPTWSAEQLREVRAFADGLST